MTYGDLSFNTLGLANEARLPLFKNNKKESAHSRPDGSDWSPAQWIQATFGELGEMCEARCKYEAGDLTFDEFRKQVGKEMADVQIYHEITSKRILDDVDNTGLFQDHAQTLMELIAALGNYANCRKKYDRGDFSKIQYVAYAAQYLRQSAEVLSSLMEMSADEPKARTTKVRLGVNLGAETIAKFNEVSKRIECNIFIDDNGMRSWVDTRFTGQAPPPSVERRK